ncbi:MAG: hypothetical protein HY855_16250 [Burkholderiales bacterium]|nr:hypothetical protein [Burkholderiales bacterium]
MNPQDTRQTMQQYAAGQRLGECLVRGCTVMAGRIRALGSPQPAPGEDDPKYAMPVRSVELQVREWLVGPPLGDTVLLQHAARPALGKTALGPWLAWEGVRLETGAELTVARWSAQASRPSWMGQPEDVALAVSDPRLQAALREAVQQHLRQVQQPDQITQLPQWLRERQDAFLLGYALGVLMNGEATHNADRATTLLTDLLGLAAMPAPVRLQVADWLGGNFYRLSEAARRATTQALVVLGSADDAGVAGAAVSVLVRLGDLQLLDLRPAPSPARRRKLIDAYRALQARQPGAHPAFESQLGVH